MAKKLLFGIFTAKCGGTSATKKIEKIVPPHRIYNFKTKPESLHQQIAIDGLSQYDVVLGRGSIDDICRLRNAGYETRAFTILRHPVERLFSSYRAAWGSDTRQLKQNQILKRENLGQLDWVKKKARNYFIMNIQGADVTVSEAIDGFESNFDLVGTVEKYDNFWKKAEQKFGWHAREVPRLNVSNFTKDDFEVEQSALEAAHIAMAKDIELFNHFNCKL